jgi:hypothetical protein
MPPPLHTKLVSCNSQKFRPLYIVQVHKTSYVGQTVPLASEYHEHDFDWNYHALLAAPLVQKQEERALALRSKPLDVGDIAPVKGPSNQEEHHPTTRLPLNEVPTNEHEGRHWEAFYKQHVEARFYKLRRYILLEFPALAKLSEGDHVMEIGCGCGSSILPVLAANPSVAATVTVRESSI